MNIAYRNLYDNDDITFNLEEVVNLHYINTELPLDDEMYEITNNVFKKSDVSYYNYSDYEFITMENIADLKWHHRNNYASTEFPLLHYPINDEDIYFMNVYDKLNKKIIQEDNSYKKIDTLGKLINELYSKVNPTPETPLIINFSHCSPPFTQNNVYFTERWIRNHKRKANQLEKDVNLKINELKNIGKRLELKKTGPESYKKEERLC